MKQSHNGLIGCCILLFAMTCFSQSMVELDGSVLSLGKYFAVCNSITIKPDFLAVNEYEEHHAKPGGIVTGAVFISAGAAMGITGQILGKQAYHKYLRSAFTENTDRLRRRASGFNVLRVAGGICGGAGLFIMVFSF